MKSFNIAPGINCVINYECAKCGCGYGGQPSYCCGCGSKEIIKLREKDIEYIDNYGNEL